MPDTRTAYQRNIDNLRRNGDLDWAPRAGCQPATLAMCCEKCVYGTGEHRRDCYLNETLDTSQKLSYNPLEQ